MTKSVRLLALGDWMMEHALGQSPFYPMIQASELSTANLEAPLTDQGYPSDKTVAMKSPPDTAGELARVGLTVATLANNHALDFGPEGMRQNRQALEAAGVRCVGTGENLAEALAPVFVEVNGLRVGFLSFSSTLPIGSAAGPSRPGMAPIRVQSSYLLDASICEEQPGTAPYVATEVIGSELQQAVAMVSGAKAQCDALVVALHWGVPEGWGAPAQGPLADYQQPLGRALIDAGADALLGTHPHVTHGIEVYRGRPIFYSLGNFTSHYFARGRTVDIVRNISGFKFDPGGFDLSRYKEIPEHGKAFAARVELRPNGIGPVEILPYVLDHQGEPQYGAHGEQASILSRIERLSAPFRTRLERRSDGTGLVQIDPTQGGN